MKIRSFFRRDIIWLIILAIFTMTAGAVFAYNTVNMRTYVKYTDASTPVSGDIEFTSYYNNDDTYIHTEDSYNSLNTAYGTSPNLGWYSAIGYARVNTDQFPAVILGTPYT